MTHHTILFDLDNTLYPESNGFQEAIGTRIFEFMRLYLGLNRDEAFALRQRYYKTYGTTLRGLQIHHGVEIEPFLAFIHDIAYDSFLQHDHELDQLLGTLRGTRAIFTNSPAEHAHLVLRLLGIARHFGTIVDIRFQQFLPKPHIAGYQKALDLLGVAATSTIMVEDTLQNLDTARQLGMRTVFISPTQPPHEHPADYVVPDIYAALRVIQELQ